MSKYIAYNDDKASHPDVVPDYIDEPPQDDVYDESPFIQDGNPFSEPSADGGGDSIEEESSETEEYDVE